MINSSVEINRPPADVFAYLDEVERHGEWQQDIVNTKKETDGPVGVGTRVTNMRRVGPGSPRPVTYEITDHDPPRRTVFRGVNGPVRPQGTVTVEPLDDGTRSRVSLQFDLVGHGLLGKLLAPMARRQASRTIPRDQQSLKQKLESGAT
jgi:uncharacterized protein YndB with AHSA1/START domain